MKNKNKKKRLIIIGIASAVLLTGGFFGITALQKHNKEVAMIEKSVQLYPISGSEKIFMSGIIAPVKSQDIFVGANQGELSTIKVTNRQYVNKGDALFTCKNTSQINEIADLEEQISIKKKEKLKVQAEDKESNEMIDAEINELNRQIAKLSKTAYSTVYAPFSGEVYIANNIIYDNPSGPVMTIESTDFYVKAQVNERDSYKVKLEQKVEITTLATKDKYTGQITEIGNRPVSDPDLQALNTSNSPMTNYEIRIELENQKNLKNGLHVQGVAVHGSEGIKIPTSSIQREGSKHYVYKVVNDKAEKIEIKIVAPKDEFTIISGGVKENDSIIKEIDGKNINDGDQVYPI